MPRLTKLKTKISPPARPVKLIVANKDTTAPIKAPRKRQDGRGRATRTMMAKAIVSALWGVPEPPDDDLEVGWYVASDEPLEARYAKALTELARACADDDPLLS